MGRRKNPKSKAAIAVALVLAGKMTEADAARHVGVSRQAVNRAMARRVKRTNQPAARP